MATTKVSSLTEITSTTGSEELLINDGGTSKKITIDNVTENNFTDTLKSKLDAIEASADVTDTTNVTSAGALMDSEVTNLAAVKAFDTTDYATAAQGTTADAALPKAGGTMTGTIAGFTSTGIDDNATSTAITIDASEWVGIGTTNPTNKLDCRGGAVFGSGTDGLKLTYSGGNSTGIIDTGFTSTAIEFRVANSEKARITSNGLTFNGDTAAANALDDYEEGTWTPEWTGSGGAPSGVNYSKRVGTYVKVGNSVTIIGAIAVSSWSSAPTGNLQISGLPFTNGSEDGGINIGNAKYIDCNGTALMGQLNANAATIDLYGYNDNASYANSTAANTGSSNFIWFSATYII